MSATVPPAVTATPNTDVKTYRGELGRASLRFEVVELPGRAERLAWLATWLPRLPGAAIIFISDPHLAAAPDADQLRTQFGLTRAEAAFVREIVKGVGIRGDHFSEMVAVARTYTL